MKIFTLGINDGLNLEDSCACIGYFDGLHLGHLELIKETLNKSKSLNYKSALITFDHDPWYVLGKISQEKGLTTIEDRAEILKELGVDYLYVLKFDLKMASMSGQDFIDQVIVAHNIKHLVCGFDFYYGRHGQGSIESLKDHANDRFTFSVVSEVDRDQKKVSTTRISDLIVNGDIKTANILLSRPYKIKAKVIKGNHLGTTIGFPTANLKVVDYYLLPANGVYIGKIFYKDHEYKAMVNIGHNPTFNYVDQKSIEVFILDFNLMIYDEKIELMFLEFIRPEIKFINKEALIAQLKEDEAKVRNFFA